VGFAQVGQAFSLSLEFLLLPTGNLEGGL
jgi:hypothetical protein